MAQRPIWRGHLRLALVSCPVALYSAKHDRGSIRFNMINPKTGNRIKMVSLDAGTKEEVQRRDTVKGYEFKKDHYLIVTDEDFDEVKVESSAMMNVEKFVEAGSIDPIYYEASYYLAPDGKAGEDVYAVLREAIEKTGRVALTRVVISQRERTIALRPMEGGLVAHVLNEARDLNDAKPLFEDAQHIKTDPDMVQLATQLIDRQTSTYDPSDTEDRYETRLRAMIDAKIKGQGYDQEDAAPAAQTNVIDLMAALKKSLADARKEEPVPVAAKLKATPKKEPERRQTALKLPIEGGKSRKAQAAVEEIARPVRPRRKAS